MNPATTSKSDILPGAQGGIAAASGAAVRS